MNIGIIGSGKVGRALGSWIASLGHGVLFASRHERTARDASTEAGRNARAVAIATALRESELVLLTLPFAAVVPALEPHAPLLEHGAALVDVTNPLTPDRHELSIGHTSSGAESIAAALPGARLVKAFNAVFAEVYAARQPRLGGARVAICYAGDDLGPKRLVAQLIAELGFDPIDAGPLRNARYLEPLSVLNIQLGRVLGHGTAIGFALARPLRPHIIRPPEHGENMALVRDFMTKPPIKVATTATVREAAQQMRSADIGALVVEEDGKPYGIVTDRDIAIRAVAQGLNTDVTPIASICSKELTTVSPDDHIDSALRLMREKALRRVLVVDYEKAPIGVVSLGDLAVRRDSHSVLGEISAAPPNH